MPFSGVSPKSFTVSANNDSLEQDPQLRTAEGGCVRGHEGALLESFVPQRVAVTVPVEDLDAVSPPIAEDKERTAFWVLAKLFACHSSEPVKTATHIGGALIEVDTSRAGESDHEAPTPRARKTWAMLC